MWAVEIDVQMYFRDSKHIYVQNFVQLLTWERYSVKRHMICQFTNLFDDKTAKAMSNE